jgi:hypothetical protein
MGVVNGRGEPLRRTMSETWVTPNLRLRSSLTASLHAPGRVTRDDEHAEPRELSAALDVVAAPGCDRLLTLNVGLRPALRVISPRAPNMAFRGPQRPPSAVWRRRFA